MNIHHQVQELGSRGFLCVAEMLNGELLDRLLAVSKQRSAALRDALAGREIGIGSKAGFIEIVQRSPGRWDVPIAPQEFGVRNEEFPWWPLISAALEAKAVHAFSGVVSSEPNSPAQHWHTDSPHEAKQHLPPHAINVLIALHDLPLEMGPTECAEGSHRLTNHLHNPNLILDQLIYQHEHTSPEALVADTGNATPVAVTQSMTAGTCLIFDDRLMHRGLANNSNSTRHVAYFSYRRRDYHVNTHFETERSVFD